MVFSVVLACVIYCQHRLPEADLRSLELLGGGVHRRTSCNTSHTGSAGGLRDFGHFRCGAHGQPVRDQHTQYNCTRQFIAPKRGWPTYCLLST
jgi:hypothetical protein